ARDEASPQGPPEVRVKGGCLIARKLGWAGALCLAGALLIMLASSDAAWSQGGPGAEGLLEQVHRDAGITCARCHGEKPSEPVPTAVCAGCHPNVKEPSPSGDLHNPHDSHMPFPDCSSCHHAHKPSENQCNNCHNFEFKMR
ncbi:MAG: cytochrome c3 family protein, partial [Desulfomonilia bacterium]